MNAEAKYIHINAYVTYIYTCIATGCLTKKKKFQTFFHEQFILSRIATAKMKSILVFLTIISATFAWRNYAQEERWLPKSFLSKLPCDISKNLDFNMEATVQWDSSCIQSWSNILYHRKKQELSIYVLMEASLKHQGMNQLTVAALLPESLRMEKCLSNKRMR